MNFWFLTRVVAILTASACLSDYGAQAQTAASPEQSRQIAVARITPSTVQIQVEGKAEVGPPSLPGFDFGNDKRKEIFRSQSTGFVIDAAKGEIITAAYNVQNADTITITLPDGTTRKATVAGVDKDSDVAILRTDPSGLVAVNWSDSVNTGEDCAIYGQAADLGLVASFGMVAGVKLHSEDIKGDFIAVTSPEAMGMAGAPVFDMKAHVIGMAYMRADPDRHRVGLAIVLPVEVLKKSIAAATAGK
jgi:S1-C subfamily serine protease